MERSVERPVRLKWVVDMCISIACHGGRQSVLLFCEPMLKGEAENGRGTAGT